MSKCVCMKERPRDRKLQGTHTLTHSNMQHWSAPTETNSAGPSPWTVPDHTLYIHHQEENRGLNRKLADLKINRLRQKGECSAATAELLSTLFTFN